MALSLQINLSAPAPAHPTSADGQIERAERGDRGKIGVRRSLVEKARGTSEKGSEKGQGKDRAGEGLAGFQIKLPLPAFEVRWLDGRWVEHVGPR